MSGKKGKEEIHSARKRPPMPGSLYTSFLITRIPRRERKQEGARQCDEVVPFLLGAIFRLLSTRGTRGSPAWHRLSVKTLNYSQRRNEGSGREKKKRHTKNAFQVRSGGTPDRRPSRNPIVQRRPRKCAHSVTNAFPLRFLLRRVNKLREIMVALTTFSFSAAH